MLDCYKVCDAILYYSGNLVEEKKDAFLKGVNSYGNAEFSY